MAEPKKEEKETKAAAAEETPQEKADREERERQQKASDEKQKVVKGIVEDLTERLRGYGAADLNDILTEVKAQVGSLHVVAAGAQHGPTVSEIKELTEKHTPYVTPPVPPGGVPLTNIAHHAATLEEEKGKKKTA
jgi:hypothetical protein